VQAAAGYRRPRQMSGRPDVGYEREVYRRRTEDR
jgi:hypothetical protein